MTEGSLGRPFGILLLQFVWRNKTQAVKPDFQVVKAGSFTPSLTSDLDCCRRTLGLDECARDNPLIVRKAEASESGHERPPHEFVRLHRNDTDPCQPGQTVYAN